MRRIIALIMLIFLVKSASAIGIGMGPSEITLDNAIKGTEYERSITIFNTGSEATNFSLSSTGSISSWMRFYDVEDTDKEISTIYIPGQGKDSIIVRFLVPDDVANGNYTGSLNVKSIPETAKGEGTGQQLIIGASSQVTIVLTGNQIIEGTVKGISIEDTEPGFPLKIKTEFQNTGNVIANPEISVTILKDNDIIASFIDEKNNVKPVMTEIIITEWNTTASNVAGDYIANVVISLDESKIKSDNLSFKILPVGTLSRQGNLTDIHIEGEPVVGSVLKIKSNFKNTGQVDTSAKFSGEVFKDNTLIDTVSSDELTIEKYKDAELTSYLKVTSPGDYLVKGKVIFSGKETDTKEISFKVTNKSTPGFGVIGASIVFLALIFIYRNKLK